MKQILFLLLLWLVTSHCANSQYIGVKARYTETRTIDNPGFPPSRENRLLLSFFEVSTAGVYTPISLSNADLWIYKEGLQYGSITGSVQDSSGNNYPGYAMTAPKVVSYYNSYQSNYIDCLSYLTSYYTINGHQLDCGFIRVSHWDTDPVAGNPIEIFTAPNICLPYYFYPDPYYVLPGNVNFQQPIPATAPYNWYSFTCDGSTQQLIIRGVLAHDSSLLTLPVRFADISATRQNAHIEIKWSNLSEQEVDRYEIEKAENGDYKRVGSVDAMYNLGERADYLFHDNVPTCNNGCLYRIKGIEKDGKVVYSQTVRLAALNTIAEPLLYPNPIASSPSCILVRQVPAGMYTVQIRDAMGEMLLSKNIQHVGTDLKVTSIPPTPGIYFLQLLSPKHSFSFRFIIQ